MSDESRKLTPFFLDGYVTVEEQKDIVANDNGEHSESISYYLMGIYPDGDGISYVDTYLMEPIWKETQKELNLPHSVEARYGPLYFSSKEAARRFMIEYGLREMDPDKMRSLIQSMRVELESRGGQAMENAAANEEKKEIEINISRKLLGQPFEAGNRTLVEISIPNANPEDKSKWRTTVVHLSQITDDEKNPNRAIVHYRETSTVTLRKSTPVELSGGELEYVPSEEKIPAAELKAFFDGRQKQRTEEKKEEISIHFGKGYARKFVNKDGKDRVAISIPREDGPWKSFVLLPNRVFEDKNGTALYAYLPKDGSTTLRWSEPAGKNTEGNMTYEKKEETVSNVDLKKMIESYKEKSLMESLNTAKEEIKQAPAQAQEKSQENAL